MAKDIQTRAPSAAEIEAFLAAKKQREADEKAEAKASNGKPAKERFPGLEYHTCTVNGGRKYEDGTVVECIWVGQNKFRQDTARILLKEKDADGNQKSGWINPKFLKGGKPMDPAKVARIKAERETESDEMVLVPCSVGPRRDKSVLLNYTGWYGGVWFPKSLITKVGETANGLSVFEVPAWKVRKDEGGDALTTLRSKQDAIKALIVDGSSTEITDDEIEDA